MANIKISGATILTGTGLISRPAALAGSNVDYKTCDNFSATSDPTVNDDNNDGYHIGSLWVRSDLGHVWICRNATGAAAKWDRIFGDDRVAGTWFMPALGIPITGSAPGIDSIRLFPIVGLRTRVTISELATRCATAQAAQNMQMAVYATNRATNRPTGNALGSTGNISVAATGNISGAVGANFTLEPSDGIVAWVASNCSHAAPAFMSLGTAFAGPMASMVGSATLGNVFSTTSGFINGLSVVQTFGTWPDLTAASFTELISAAIPYISLKVVSVP